jgi:regulation of enolase protein 1 (concanavalin A-like superfamily)
MSWQTTRVTALKLPGLPFPLEPAGSPPPGCRVRHGALILTAAAGTDLFVDPGGPVGPGPQPDAGRFTGLPPAGDFALAAQVSVEFGGTYDAGALLLHAAERQWAKLCFEYSPQLRPTAVTVVTRGTSDDCNSLEVAGTALWLRITRTGAARAFHASTDGSWWRLLRYLRSARTRCGSVSWPSRPPARAVPPPSTTSRSGLAPRKTSATAADVFVRQLREAGRRRARRGAFARREGAGGARVWPGGRGRTTR